MICFMLFLNYGQNPLYAQYMLYSSFPDGELGEKEERTLKSESQ